VLIRIEVWNVTLLQFISGYQCFGGACCLHYQSPRSVICAEKYRYLIQGKEIVVVSGIVVPCSEWGCRWKAQASMQGKKDEECRYEGSRGQRENVWWGAGDAGSLGCG
jgi:hypothetical protein